MKNSESKSSTPDDILDIIKQFYSEAFPVIKKTARNDALRREIFKNLISQFMTDDERAEYYGLPNGCRIRESAKIIQIEKLSCGKNVWIGENCILDASGGLSIGSNTTISVATLIWTHTSILSNMADDNSIGSSLIRRSRVDIGDQCYIGGPCSIYPGVKIGNRSVVLPMSVVASDVEANSIVAGVPAKKIGIVTEEWLEKIKNNPKYKEDAY